MPNVHQKFAQFLSLHHKDDAFVIPNAWDAGSTRLLSSLGFEAIATTSAGYAFSKGKRDSFAALSRDEILANAREIVDATDLPVSADLENGFGATPEDCAQTIALAVETGLCGGSIEDATGNPDDPIYPFELTVERIEAAVEAAKDQPFVLTARAENWLWGKPDLKDTIHRLQAFCEAGADVVYAPGLRDLDLIKTVCKEVDKPVNAVIGGSGAHLTVRDLSAAGVKRISVGGTFARAAFGAIKEAALEIRDTGTFGYVDNAMPGPEIEALMDDH